MEIAALIVAVLALIVSLGSATYTRRQATAGESQARAARNADLREREPRLEVTLNEKVGEGDNSALYYLRNLGPQDLESVVIQRPKTDDGVRYEVARLGEAFAGEAELGPLELGHRQGFVLAIGSREYLPSFRVRIVCRAGDDLWESSVELEDPHFHINVF
jgi:hypothetical protein